MDLDGGTLAILDRRVWASFDREWRSDNACTGAWAERDMETRCDAAAASLGTPMHR
jgi:hypothetical protein